MFGASKSLGEHEESNAITEQNRSKYSRIVFGWSINKCIKKSFHQTLHFS
jgi:hypothetical protein